MMLDREKVIRIIDELIFEAQKEPNWKAESALKCLKKELMKEQEAVEPLPPESEIGTLWRCGSCGREIGYKYHFCQWCGQAVKWE